MDRIACWTSQRALPVWMQGLTRAWKVNWNTLTKTEQKQKTGERPKVFEIEMWPEYFAAIAIALINMNSCGAH